ncbi:MAG: AMP-binding protein [Actinomycetia bacterium]|nr:AMP-binding protein [Actinomycetes bacterium]
MSTALRRIDASLFRVVLLGGSAIPANRPDNSVATYGMTESGSGVVYDGVPLDGVEVRVVEGELQLRCKMLLRCYRDGTDPKTDDGWYPTGDLGTFDGGRVQVHGRAGDLIITGGENVFPEPIERRLLEHPDVLDAAIVGVADEEWGQRLVAVVVPHDEVPSLGDLRDHVRANLPAWCAPRQVVEAKAIPRTALGKIRRAELARAVVTG